MTSPTRADNVSLPTFVVATRRAALAEARPVMNVLSAARPNVRVQRPPQEWS